MLTVGQVLMQAVTYHFEWFKAFFFATSRYSRCSNTKSPWLNFVCMRWCCKLDQPLHSVAPLKS